MLHTSRETIAVHSPSLYHRATHTRDTNRPVSTSSPQSAVLGTQTKTTYSRLSYGTCRLGMPSARITRDVFLGDSIVALGT
jgi:hypothetical protein